MHRQLHCFTYGSIKRPRVFSLLAGSRQYGSPKRSSRLDSPAQLAIIRCLSSDVQGTTLDQNTDQPRRLRQITFPDTRKGKKAEREAHDYWASLWRTVPEVDDPLVFKIDDGHDSIEASSIDVNREGITFPKGDIRGERYWRLSHPISWTTRLRRLRWRLRVDPLLPLRTSFSQWLYGGSSKSLSAKLQWLITGPSTHPWSQRSRWIRWSIYGLIAYLVSVAVLVPMSLEQVPLTGRWRLKSGPSQYPSERLEVFRSQAAAHLHEQFKNLKSPDDEQASRLNSILKPLLHVCGLGDFDCTLHILEDPDLPIAGVSAFGHVTVSTGLLDLMNSKDELAAVLSHELSHVLAEHHWEAVDILFIRRVMGYLLLPMLVGAFFAPRLILTAAIPYISSGLLVDCFSRGREKEADYMGMLLMAEAGFDPAATITTWDKLINFKNSAGRGLPQPPTFVSTHPKLASRMTRSEELLPDAIRLTGKNKSLEMMLANGTTAFTDFEIRWKEFLAGNAERASSMPWLKTTSSLL